MQVAARTVGHTGVGHESGGVGENFSAHGPSWRAHMHAGAPCGRTSEAVGRERGIPKNLLLCLLRPLIGAGLDWLAAVGAALYGLPHSRRAAHLCSSLCHVHISVPPPQSTRTRTAASRPCAHGAAIASCARAGVVTGQNKCGRFRIENPHLPMKKTRPGAFSAASPPHQPPFDRACSWWAERGRAVTEQPAGRKQG